MDMPNFHSIPSPAFVLDMDRFMKNLSLMKDIQQNANVDIILALKGFSLWHVFPLVKNYLAGATASSLHEALLIFNEIFQMNLSVSILSIFIFVNLHSS